MTNFEKHLTSYSGSLCSIDKAVHETKITVAEMMQEAAKAGTRSDQKKV